MRYTFLWIALLISLTGFSQSYYLFIGTYTSGKSEGIYVYRFNGTTGDAQPISTIASKNPSYLALSHNGRYVYAVNEMGGKGSGEVSAFSFDKKTGKLTFINKQQSGGADPCYVAIDESGKWAVVANYSGGSLAALPLKTDGSVQPVAELIQHSGNSADTQRQEKAHVHSAFFSPDQHFVLSADLGMDHLMIYRFNPLAASPLSDATDSVVTIQPGSGPRHLAFHPTQPYLYLLEELSGTIDAYHYASGKLSPVQRISSVPDDFKGDRGSADIHISPNGKFLYASNRGDADNIAIYAIDPKNGTLAIKGFQPVAGKHPRNFIIDPSGHFLLVANRDTDNVVVFAVDPQTGLLRPAGKEISIPNPVCLKLLKE